MRASAALALLAVGCVDPEAIGDATGAVYRNGHQWCTATLIDPQTAVTAAHCAVDGLSFAGEKVEAAIPHPNWMPDRVNNDIGLLKLARPSVAPFVELEDVVPKEGDELQVVGYRDGAREDSVFAVRTVVLPAIYLTTIDGALCPGDSGGPSFLDGRLVGIHSRANCESYAIDTSLAFYFQWISDNR